MYSLLTASLMLNAFSLAVFLYRKNKHQYAPTRRRMLANYLRRRAEENRLRADAKAAQEQPKPATDTNPAAAPAA